MRVRCDRLLLRLVVLLVCCAPLGSVAAQAPSAAAPDPGLTMKRAAIVTGALTIAFAGAGTALLATQPTESFAGGIGVGHLLWSPALAAQTIIDIIAMQRARHRSRPMSLAAGPLWMSRVNVVASSAIMAGGLGATIAGLTIDDAEEATAGIGTVFATYGAALVAFTAWELVQAKRRRKCMETCPVPARSGAFTLRF